MPGSYRHSKDYEREFKENGLTSGDREKIAICQRANKGICKAHNKKKRKIAAGMEMKTKGRPRKNGAELPPSVQQ